MTNALIDKATFMASFAEAAYNRLIQEDEVKSCTCDKCNKVVEFKERSDGTRDFLGLAPLYHIDLGRGVYGSELDGSDMKFDVCDTCMVNFIKSFPQEQYEAIEYSGVHYSKEVYEALSDGHEEYVEQMELTS